MNPTEPSSVNRVASGGNFRRRGTIFVTTMWAMVVLVGIMLTFTRSVRVEGNASINRVSFLQASAAERAGEQWAIAMVEHYRNDARTIVTTPAEAIRVGDGYFWIIGFND